jgi:DNA-binding transcriptional MerR regulator/methylmalonyl-CoA mutase cobalamin-binding subunit
MLSQIKAHTIRIWEQRYHLLAPSRSEGNTRYYDEDQLMKLLKVALLNKSGMKISHIAHLNQEELIIKTNEVALNNQSIDASIEQLMVASMNFDQQQITKLFDNYHQLYGVEKAFEEILFPFLRVIGNLWINGKITPGHEHFFTNLCKLKLYSNIEQLPLPPKNNPRILLSLPEWDYHELGILYYHYLFRKAGYNCTYLGQAVPAIDVIQTAKKIDVNSIITTFIGPTSKEQIINYIEMVLQQTEQIVLYMSGPQLNFKIENYNGRLVVFRSIKVLIKDFKLKTDK